MKFGKFFMKHYLEQFKINFKFQTSIKSGTAENFAIKQMEMPGALYNRRDKNVNYFFK